MKKFVSLLLVAVLALSLVACGSGENAANNAANTNNVNNTAETEEPSGGGEEVSVLDKVLESGKLVVGTSADYPPYEFHIMEDGEDKIVGFDIAIAEEIAKDLGVELEISDMDFDAILSSVATGVADVGIAGINPDPERDKTVDFSDIYFTSSYTVLINEADLDKIKTQEDLNGLSLGVQIGTVQEGLAHDEVEGANVVALPKVTELVMQLQTGMVDALILEVPVATSYVSQNEGLAMVEDIDFAGADIEGGSAAIVTEGETALLEEINKTIQRLIDEGKIDEFYAEAVALSDKEIAVEEE